jgi:hypothetical protein
MTITSPAGPLTAAGPPRMSPGRWAALAVAVPVALALIGWTAFSLVAAVATGSYPVSYAVPVRDGQVALNVNSGDVTLRPAAASGSARLDGTVRYSLIRPHADEAVSPDGTNLDLNCSPVPGNCGLSAVLAVPPRTAVSVRSNGGDIAASGFSAGLNLDAGGGDITASSLTGRVQLDTEGGDLAADGLDGTVTVATEGGNVDGSNWTVGPNAQVDTSGGDLSLSGLAGDLQLTSEGGNVSATGVTSGAITLSSGGGDVSLAFSQPPQNLQITAQGGNVTVILPPGATRYAIATPDTAGGNVSYPASLEDPQSSRTITVNSSGGNIAISQG